MKVKMKEVTTYGFHYSQNLGMCEKGKVFINPYLVTIERIGSYRMEEISKDFAILHQQGETYYVLLEDIEDIIEIHQ